MIGEITEIVRDKQEDLLVKASSASSLGFHERIRDIQMQYIGFLDALHRLEYIDDIASERLFDLFQKEIYEVINENSTINLMERWC